MGPPILTINHDNTFMLTDLNRRINPEGHLDIFSDDTRFPSYYAYYLDGHVLKRLTSTTTTYYAARVHLTNPNFVSRDGFIQEGTLALVISRAVEQGIHEDLDLTNYGLQTARFNLEIALRSDFANIFQVESRQFVRRGRIETRWDEANQELSTKYCNGEFYRCLTYRLIHCSSSPHYANRRITFEIELAPGQTWHTCADYILADNEPIREQLEVDLTRMSSASRHH